MYKVVLMMALSSTGADLPIPYSGPGSCWGGPGCYGWSNCFAGRACSGSIGFSAFNRGSGGSGGYACQGSTGSYSNVGPVVEKETLSPKTKPAHTSPVEELHAPKEAASARQATIVVSLPPGAKLTFDGQPTAQNSATRRFITPPLDLDKNLQYLLRVEMADGGLRRILTERIDVRPGQEVHVLVDFTKNEIARVR